MHNAIKHGQPTEVAITLSQREGVVCLDVSDNGKGFSNSEPQSHGMGLSIMRHRAVVIGADLDVQSKSGKGVTVLCTLRSNL